MHTCVNFTQWKCIMYYAGLKKEGDTFQWVYMWAGRMNARLFESFCANVGFGSYSAFLMSIEHQVIFATSLIHPVIDPHSYKQFFSYT